MVGESQSLHCQKNVVRTWKSRWPWPLGRCVHRAAIVSTRHDMDAISRTSPKSCIGRINVNMYQSTPGKSVMGISCNSLRNANRPRGYWRDSLEAQKKKQFATCRTILGAFTVSAEVDYDCLDRLRNNATSLIRRSLTYAREHQSTLDDICIRSCEFPGLSPFSAWSPAAAVYEPIFSSNTFALRLAIKPHPNKGDGTKSWTRDVSTTAKSGHDDKRCGRSQRVVPICMSL
jgi:hypothetical protein